MTRQGDLLRDQRRAFAAPGSTHDRVVRLLATVLPAAVGVVVAAMVMTPLFPRNDVSFLLDRNRVAITEERLKVTDAVYRGLDSKARAFSVTAQGAVQHSADIPVVAMNQLAASLQLDDGPARLTAPTGDYDMRSDIMHANGPVDYRGAGGYHMVTSGVDVDLRGKRATGTGGVQGVIPSGTFSADRITADLAGESVTLEGHARLRMVPGKLRVPK
ncbi:MAG: LPS export ABC transporter periplasmic protein LptC [Pseudomonadota bacterium]|nr:LPS export ABC transporter periplasmic protein LptC [Pseudomonadota bacterium]